MSDKYLSIPPASCQDPDSRPRSAPSSPLLIKRRNQAASLHIQILPSTFTMHSISSLSATRPGSAPNSPPTNRRKSLNLSCNSPSPQWSHVLHQHFGNKYSPTETRRRLSTPQDISLHQTLQTDHGSTSSTRTNVSFHCDPPSSNNHSLMPHPPNNKLSYSDGHLNVTPRSPSAPSHRCSSVDATRHFHICSNNCSHPRSDHKRERRPSYMRETFTSDKKRWHVLQQDNDSDSSSDEEPPKTPEFHAPMMLPPIWMTSAGKTPVVRRNSSKKVIPTITITPPGHAAHLRPNSRSNFNRSSSLPS